MAVTAPSAAGGPTPPAPCDSDIYGRLVCARRVWAVGAIHADAQRLERLHDRLAERFAPGDRLVYLGNYMGTGPDVAGTIDELISFRTAILCRAGMEPDDIVFLRGAQEEMWRKLLQIQFAPAPLDG